MTEAEILNLPGIVVRKMPTVVVSRWRYWVQTHGPYKDRPNLQLVEGPDDNGLYIVEEKRPVSEKLASKFLVTFTHGTGSTVHFSLDHCGIGDTIPEAYEDLNGKSSKR